MNEHNYSEILGHLARQEVRHLPPYNAGLSSAVVRERYGVEQVARLGSNENPFGSSQAVGQALSTMSASVGLYPDPNCRALRSSIAQRVGAHADEIVIGNGSENLLEILCQAFLNKRDMVVTVRPAFGLHEIYPQMMGASVEAIPVTSALEFDVDAMCAAVSGSHKPKLVMFSNPSNPVGCMLDTKAFNRIVQATPINSLIVIDEAYYEYAVLNPDFPDTLSIMRAQERPWIVLRTFSKAWGLAGLRVGYGITCDKRLVQLLDRVRTPFNVNMAAQIAALSAWNEPDFMESCVRSAVAWRDELAIKLRNLNLMVGPSAANFLFVNVNQSNTCVAEELLKRGVIVKPWKEAGYEQFIRVSIGSIRDNLQFLSAIKEILK